MRIVMFTDTYRPQVNGAVTSIDSFAAALRKMGHDVQIFAPASPGYSQEHVHFSPSIPFPLYKGYRVGISFATAPCDVVHIHSPFAMGLAGINAARKNSVPVFGTFHTMISDYAHYAVPEHLLKVRAVRNFVEELAWNYMRWVYNKCDAVIAPSKHTAALLKRKGFRNVVYIPTGIDKKNAAGGKKEQLKKKHGLAGKKIMLHVGRVTKEKNLRTLVASLKPLLEKRNVILVITSDGPYRSELEEEVRKMGMAGRIAFTGYLGDRNLQEFYAMSDVFVTASKTETQGLVLLEAVKSRLPIVVLDAPVTADFVAENKVGIVTTEKKFSTDVERMLYNTKTRNTLRKNFAPALKRFDAKACAKELLKIYSGN